MTTNEIWKRLVVLMYGELCPMCGQQAVDVHHIYPKGIGGASLNVCYNPLNGIPLCRMCHDYIHLSIGEVKGREWLATKLPHVLDRMHESHPVESDNKKEMRKELQQMIKELS